MLSGIVTLFRLLQPLNALSPMLVTLLGIVTFVKLLQSSNAEPAISLVSAFIAASVISFFAPIRQRFKYSNPFFQLAGSL